MAEAGVAGAGVVDREANGRPELRELVAERRVVVDRDVLGDLENDRRAAPARSARSAPEPMSAGETFRLRYASGGRIAVAASSAARRVAVSSSIPSPARTAAANTDVGRDAVGEAAERLVADDRSGMELDDRLEERREGRGVEDRLDAALPSASRCRTSSPATSAPTIEPNVARAGRRSMIDSAVSGS